MRCLLEGRHRGHRLGPVDAVNVEGVAVPEIPEVDLILDGPNGSRARNTFPAWLEGLREPVVISGLLALFRRQHRR